MLFFIKIIKCLNLKGPEKLKHEHELLHHDKDYRILEPQLYAFDNKIDSINNAYNNINYDELNKLHYLENLNYAHDEDALNHHDNHHCLENLNLEDNLYHLELVDDNLNHLKHVDNNLNDLTHLDNFKQVDHLRNLNDAKDLVYLQNIEDLNNNPENVNIENNLDFVEHEDETINVNNLYNGYKECKEVCTECESGKNFLLAGENKGADKIYNHAEISDLNYYNYYLSNKSNSNGSEKDGPVILHGTYNKYGEYVDNDRLFSGFNKISTQKLNKILGTNFENGNNIKDGFKTPKWKDLNDIDFKYFDGSSGKAKLRKILGHDDSEDSDESINYPHDHDDYDEYGKKIIRWLKRKNLAENCVSAGDGFGHLRCNSIIKPNDKSSINSIKLTNFKGKYRYKEANKKQELKKPIKKSHRPYKKEKIFFEVDGGYSAGERLHIMKMNALNKTKCGNRHHHRGIDRFETPNDHFMNK